MPKMWMIRAEVGGRLFDAFKEKGVAAIGWGEIGSLENLKTREEIFQKVQAAWSDWKTQAQRMATGQLFRLRSEIQTGDAVVTYDPSRRVYMVGTIKGEYRYDPSFEEEDPNIRDVEWRGEISRDALSTASKNSLGSIATLFLLPEAVAEDVERALIQDNKAKIEPSPAEELEQEEENLLKDMQGRAFEFTKDRISQLDWDEMQELVAGLLRAMGYKTRVSPSGPDRGKDIIASPDGFGLETPRIVVEVKHRNQATDSEKIRSFLGGRHQDDKGLYVSTGGFSKDAHYEAERGNIPLMLMNLDDLTHAVIDHYDQMDMDTQRLLPLKRVYWPA